MHSRDSRCFGIMVGQGNFAFNLGSVVKLSVELGYVFLRWRL
jgi:hypothetical protein